MKSRTRKKYDEWHEKVRNRLERKGKNSQRDLAVDCRYLRYWAEKMRSEEPRRFSRIEKSYMDLNGAVGRSLKDDYMKFLRNAQKHREGTKARLVGISRFAYYFDTYAYDCFVEAGEESQAKRILRSFWNSYGPEIVEYRDNLDDFQIDTILRLAKHSRDLGVKLDMQWISALEDMIRLPDPVLVERCKNQLKNAEENLKHDETITALVLADQSLELFLRDLCTRFGCDESSLSRRGESFSKWGFTDYVAYLSRIGEINKYDKGNFYRFHDWRNSAYHLGLEPSARVVRTVIDDVLRFIDEHSY